MKTPIDTIKGKIVSYDERTGDCLIQANYPDWYTIVKREYKECLIQMIDSRPLSEKQRKSCYALIREIAEYVGEGTNRTKEYMKLRFLTDEFGEMADKIFSLSNAPMSLVCAFQRYLVSFILEWDIPCRFPLLKFVDDIPDYIYSCLINKKCCVCGARAELHHVERVGMGRNRNKIVHEGMEAMPLCRGHHEECHNIGQRAFNEKYHFDSGIKLDKTLCRIYGLKAAKENKKDEQH